MGCNTTLFPEPPSSASGCTSMEIPQQSVMYSEHFFAGEFYKKIVNFCWEAQSLVVFLREKHAEIGHIVNFLAHGLFINHKLIIASATKRWTSV
jgi:hypothetical protein